MILCATKENNHWFCFPAQRSNCNLSPLKKNPNGFANSNREKQLEVKDCLLGPYYAKPWSLLCDAKLPQTQSCLESIHKDEKVQKVFIVKEDGKTKELGVGHQLRDKVSL